MRTLRWGSRLISPLSPSVNPSVIAAVSQARDAYYACKVAQGEEPCAKLRAAYEAVCLPSWVSHFDRKHLYEQFKAKTEAQQLKS